MIALELRSKWVALAIKQNNNGSKWCKVGLLTLIRRLQDFRLNCTNWNLGWLLRLLTLRLTLGVSLSYIAKLRSWIGKATCLRKENKSWRMESSASLRWSSHGLSVGTCWLLLRKRLLTLLLLLY